MKRRDFLRMPLLLLGLLVRLPEPVDPFEDWVNENDAKWLGPYLRFKRGMRKVIAQSDEHLGSRTTINVSEEIVEDAVVYQATREYISRNVVNNMIAAIDRELSS